MEKGKELTRGPRTDDGLVVGGEEAVGPSVHVWHQCGCAFGRGVEARVLETGRGESRAISRSHPSSQHLNLMKDDNGHSMEAES